MANYEIIPGTTGNDVQSQNARFNRRSPIKFLRLGNKRMRFFVIVPSGAAISETIVVKNGRKGEIWALNVAADIISLPVSMPTRPFALDVTVTDLVVVTPTTSGANTSYAISETTQNWTGKHLVFAVEIGQ